MNPDIVQAALDNAEHLIESTAELGEDRLSPSTADLIARMRAALIDLADIVGGDR